MSQWFYCAEIMKNEIVVFRVSDVYPPNPSETLKKLLDSGGGAKEVFDHVSQMLRNEYAGYEVMLTTFNKV